ncbi:hypothetical protein E4T38_07501 [Aureobasidium subglaciale]|nr:hypothetical protein E4T38_07501 [Aureobasidium subglaciale]KAI5217287.1 hypothetical protein E4T40_07512 [Aureobasidium subglaciale]KAI5220952.1 hypothetical protein E4T41_07353 [Aureobasidium subglaciale]KAI5258445.1 hypothetical protein E4T46_07330 [Aureobasidium subglaciale]
MPTRHRRLSENINYQKWPSTNGSILTHEPADHFSLPISICIFASITSYPLPASPSELDRRSQPYFSLCCTYNVCKFASKRPTLISHFCVRTHLSAFFSFVAFFLHQRT